ncbi:MAG: MerR family transcriptional regulator [Oscillospiraceae bacterium]
MQYTVGEMAKLVGVAPSTLRYYDKEGLLPFLERSQGGMRTFKDSDYEFLKIIECLKATGMQLKDIKKFIFMVLEGDCTINERLQLFLDQKKEVEKQMSLMEETLQTIKYKCWYYETAKKLGSTTQVDNIKNEDIPKEHQKVKIRLQKE